jgi:glycosyltransferase involved in cell wall biosynthesis
MLAYTYYEMDNRVRRYAESLSQRGDHVDVIALRREGQEAYEILNGVHVYRIQKRVVNEKGKLSYLIKLMLFLVQSAIFLTARHFKKPYSLIHVHSVPDFEVFATLIPKLMGAKIVLDIHDIVPEFYASKFKVSKESLAFKLLVLAEKASTAFADHVIIANHIWGEKLVKRSVSEKKSSVFLNYPDQSIFHSRSQVKDRDKFIILYPGSLSWHQGLDIAIKAVERIKGQHPEVELHIYGEGGEKNKLTDLVMELGLEDRVIFKGSVSMDHISDVMANADMGIVPKRNDPFGGDAFSTKILEFMSLGVPVIVAKTRVDEFYFNDTLVQFFTPEDINDLARCLRDLVRDEGRRKQLATNSSKFIEDYVWTKKKNDYYTLVDNLQSNSITSGRIN